MGEREDDVRGTDVVSSAPPTSAARYSAPRQAAHFQALVESSADAILSKDARGVITSWNAAAERLYGHSAEEAVGRSITLIIPEDHANEEKEILRRVLAGEQIDHYETERVRKDGSRVAVSLTVSPIRGPGNEIIGASVVARDIGEQVEREERATMLQEITSALAREVEPAQAIGVLVRDGVRAVGADAATLGLLGDEGDRVFLADEVGHSEEGLADWQSFPLDADLPMCTAIKGLAPIWASSADEVRERFPVLAGENFRFAALAVLPLVVEGRAIGAVSFSFSEEMEFSTERRAFTGSIVQQVAYALERARIHEAENRARMRLSFLARASAVLSESLDVRTTLERLAELAVRNLSDWCAVDLVDDGGHHETIIAHVDRSKVEFAEELRRRYPSDPDAPQGAFEVIRTGVGKLFPEITEELLRESAQDEQHFELMRQLGVASGIVVPLSARGRTHGALTFIASNRDRAFDQDDLELAEDLARRAALAIDTSILFQREHETALTLQRALLPADLPDVKGVEVATRYLPAEAGLEIGGDWYDVIESRPGQVDLVIGDVAGRGVHAAAVMGRLAMALRAYVLDGRPTEAAVAGLDQLMKGFDPPQMSTLFAFSIELESGRARFVRAGHPPALLRLADGQVVELAGQVSPPVGLLNGASFVANEATLPPGSTLLLYTDGLIERRRRDIQVGIDRLKAALAKGPAVPEEIVAGIPRALDAERVGDDIALLALRASVD